MKELLQKWEEYKKVKWKIYKEQRGYDKYNPSFEGFMEWLKEQV